MVDEGTTTKSASQRARDAAAALHAEKKGLNKSPSVRKPLPSTLKKKTGTTPAKKAAAPSSEPEQYSDPVQLMDEPQANESMDGGDDSEHVVEEHHELAAPEIAPSPSPSPVSSSIAAEGGEAKSSRDDLADMVGMLEGKPISAGQALEDDDQEVAEIPDEEM